MNINEDIAKISATVSEVNNTVNKFANSNEKINSFFTNPVLPSLQSNKPLFYDKYTFPYGNGPYQIDAIPIVIKDKFKMPKYTLNLPTDNYLYSPEQYDTLTYPEMVIYVPSNRKTPITTPIFKQDNVNEVNNIGSFNLALEDFCLSTITLTGKASSIGKNLYNKVNDFNKLVTDSSSNPIDRSNKLNDIINDPDYKLIKDNVKYPFKVWNQVFTNGNAIYENLLDLSGNVLQNTLNDGSQFTTQMTKSSWPVDSSGNPTELLPVEQNINAYSSIDPLTGENALPYDKNNKLGLFVFNMGNSNNHSLPNAYTPGLLASYGYIVIVNISNPINGGFLPTKSKTTISKLLADKVISKFDINSLTSDYYMHLNNAYTNEGTSATVNPNRANFRNSSLSSSGKLIYERWFYQQTCVLKKLGLYDKINWNNVVCGGLSAGGYSMNVLHDNLPTGLSTEYAINGIKPQLYKIKMMLSWQCVFYDVSKLNSNQRIGNYTAENQKNNKYNLGINVLKVPMVSILGDGDIYGKPQLYENLFNNCNQVIYQNTKQNYNQVTDIILSNSIALYKMCNAHIPTYYDSINRDFTSIYNNSFCESWLLGGHKIPQFSTWPSISNMIESGNQDYLTYLQYDDLRSMIAIQLLVHRFLGCNYPVPLTAFTNLGWRTDIMPTTCDRATEFQYVRIGPVSQISYDSNYNLELATNNNKISVAIDSSKNLITNASGLVLKSSDGNKSYKLVIDSSGNLTTVLV